jgi:hypothetical protein
MGAPPSARFCFAPRVGWREPQLVTFHPAACPIQALLGWDSTNFDFGASRRTCVCFSALHPRKKWVPHPRRVFVFAPRVGWREPQSVSFKLRTNTGAPSKLCLGGIARTSPLGRVEEPAFAFRPFTHHKTWVPHPRRVFVFAPRVGWHEPQLVTFHPPRETGAPSKLCLGGIAQTTPLGRSEGPAFAFRPFTHQKNGCPTLGAFLFLRLGWDGTNLNLSHSTHHEKRVPHPSSAWVG